MGYPKRERSVEELLSRWMMNLLEVDFPTHFCSVAGCVKGWSLHRVYRWLVALYLYM